MQRDIGERTFAFAVAVLRFAEAVPPTAASMIVIKQLVRSGTSVGANVEEATAASSKADFAYRIGIALREARESLYWLRIIKALDLARGESVDGILSEADQLARILGAILSSVRGTRKRS